MHSGLEHILYNMFALLVFAPPLERVLKPWRYTFFYFVCGIMGNAISAGYNVLTSDPNVYVGVGASGAIYGVFGAYLFISLFRKTQLDVASRKTVYMILIAGVIFSLIVPKADLWAHIGGALAGFLLYQIFDRTRAWRQRRRI
ncbi:Rhomboid protease GluP [compost metagenome]